MIVECPSCSTRFNLDESRIGERGAKVRCSVCSHSFVVHASVQNQVPMQDEITEVGGGLVDPSMVDPSFMPTDSVQIPAPLDMSATVPGGAAYIDHANTAPGPQPLSSNDLIEIDASEVAELDDSTGTMPSPILTTETVPGVEVNAIPETIDFEEVSGSRPSPLVETDVHDAFGDPFASDGMFGDEMRQVESLAPLDDDGDFESHATAVYDVGRLAQSPEASPGMPDLEADVPGGLGATEPEPEPAAVVYQSVSTESSFERPTPTSTARKAVSMLVTALMVVAIVGGTGFALLRTGRLDPKVLGLQKHFKTTATPTEGGYLDVYPANMRSMLYPTRMGTSVLVVTGEVENRGDSPREGLDVLAFLLGDDGTVQASGRSPVGLTFEVNELADIVDRRALEDRLSRKSTAAPAEAIAPGERRHFMIVVPSPPEGVRDLEHRLSLRPTAYAPIQAQVAPPAPAEDEAPAAVEEDNDEGTKSKRRRRRGRRRARAE